MRWTKQIVPEAQAASWPRAGERSTCPACGADASFDRFEVARQADGSNVDILICSSCIVLINRGAYEKYEATPQSRLVQKTDFYVGPTNSAEFERARIADTAGMLDYLFAKLDRKWDELTFCDLGAGRGYAALAAAQSFARSIACEFDVGNIEDVCRVIGQPLNLQIEEDIFSVDGTIDVLFAWHVLEHIPDLHAFLCRLRPKLNRDCIILLQCPCYRPDYLVDCHYLFFNEASLRRAMRSIGCSEIEIGFDVSNGFITYLGKASPVLAGPLGLGDHVVQKS